MSGTKRNKISDVAQMVGVSKSTISNYLNGRYENMSMKTRDKIEQAVKELNYTPNISARRLSAKVRCNVICIVIPVNISETFETLYYPTVLSAVGKVSAQTGYDTLIYARGDSAEKLEFMKGMANTLVDGFLFFDLRQECHYFRDFQKADIPYVCVGKYHGIDDYSFVASDHGQAIEDGVEHLISLGHAKVGLVLEKSRGVVSVAREQQFRETMARHGIEATPASLPYIETFSMSESGVNYRAIESMLRGDSRPTALLVPAGVLPILERVAQDMGLSIPRDLSVIALDYMEGYNLQIPRYTRIGSSAALVTEKAFHKLIGYLQNNRQGFESEIVPLRLIRGDTTVSPGG